MPATLMIHHLCLLSITILQADVSDFDDLGQLLLGGFVLAVVVAVTYTFIRLRMRDRKPPEQFISISSFKGTDDLTKAPRE